MRNDLTTEDVQAYLDCFTDDHNLTVAVGKAIGAENLRMLMERFPTEHLYIQPWERFCAKIQRELRNEEIRRRFNGRNLQELSDEAGLSPRTVRKILKQCPAVKDSSAPGVVNPSR